MDTEWGKLLVAKTDISAGLHHVVCRESEQLQAFNPPIS
jgi:hypothetical protein